jgi:hypothetical protein
VVPAWSLVLTFVAGLVVGVVIGLLVRRPVPAAPAAEPAAAVAEPESEPEPVPEPVPAAKLDSGVKDVVAELERRYKGRKADGDPSGGRRGSA